VKKISKVDFNYLGKLSKDLCVYYFIKDKINLNMSYDENWKIIIEEYKRRYE